LFMILSSIYLLKLGINSIAQISKFCAKVRYFLHNPKCFVQYFAVKMKFIALINELLFVSH
jgi:hypothetical protein